MKHKPKNLEVNLHDTVNVSDSGDTKTKSEKYKVKHKYLLLNITITTIISLIGFIFVGVSIIFICYIISILLIFYFPGYKEKIITIERTKF